MTKLLVAAPALALLACATLPADADPPPPDGVQGPCREQGLQDLVGREATSALGAEALRRSGARTLRWIRPNDVVTMDYRTDRLNVYLDDRLRVERFTCG